MEKKAYCKIIWNDFCELDYSETICEISNLKHEIDVFIATAECTTEQNTLENEVPGFEVEVIFLTDQEFSDITSKYEV